MADQDAIIQDVLLRGQDDIKSAFASIEQAGVQMFANLERASSTATFSGLTATIGTLLAAVTGITVATFGWATASASATTALGRLADQGGTSIEDMSTLTAALKTDSDTLGTAFKRMAVRIETEWPIIQKAQRDSANLMQADSLAIQKSYLDLEKAQITAANSGKTAAALQVANSNSIRGAALNLKDALEQQRIAEGGQADPNFTAQQNKEKAALNVANARLALSQAQQKADEDAALAANKLATEQNAAQEAALKLSQAQKKAAEDSANDINNLVTFVNNLASGTSDANLKVNASAENVVKGLIASIGPAGQALSALKGDITDVSSAPPILKDALLKLADVFHNTDDNALKTAISVQLFGRGVGQEMVEQLSKGSVAILAAQKRLTDLGLVLTEDNRLVSKELKGSMADLSNAVGIIGKQFSLTFAPTFTGIVKTMFDTVTAGRQSFLDLATAIQETATPALLGFLQAITGADFTQNQRLSEEQKKSVVQWTATFDSIVGIFKAAADVIGAVLNVIATTLNTVFGKDFASSTEVAVALLIVRFTGLAGAVVVAAIALDRLTGGSFTQWLKELPDSLSRSAERFVLLKQLLENPFNPGPILDRLKELGKEGDAAFDRVKNAGSKNNAAFVDDLKKAALDGAKGVTDAIDSAGKSGATSLDQIKIAAVNASNAVAGIGGTAKETENALIRVSKIKFIGVDDGIFGQKKNADGSNPIDKIPSASKSFGAFNDMVEQAKKLADAFGITDEEATKLAETITEFKDKPIDIKIAKLNDADLEELLPPDVEKTIGQKLAGAVKSVDDVLNPIGQSILDFFGELPAKIGSEISDGVGLMVTPFKQAATEIALTIDPIIAKVNQLVNSLAGFESGIGGGGSGGGFGSDIPTNDEGGLFLGRPGRDKNLSWITHREFIMSDKATAAWSPGLLDWMNRAGKQGNAGLMASLARAMGSPMRRFAGGGLNSTAAIAPFFGGPTTSAADERSFTLALASGRSGRVRGPKDLIDELEKIAVTEQGSRIGKDMWS